MSIEKLKLTSGLKKIQFPKKDSPRETKPIILSELKFDLDIVSITERNPLSHVKSADE